MKEIGNLINQVDNGNIQADLSRDEKKRVEAFVLSIVSLYGAKGKDLKESGNIKTIMRAYADDINRMSDYEYNKRLNKVKKLYQAGDDNFQWPADAIAKACAPLDVLNNFYRKYYPMGAAAKALEVTPKAKQIEKQNVKDPIAEVNKLKDILK